MKRFHGLVALVFSLGLVTAVAAQQPTVYRTQDPGVAAPTAEKEVNPKYTPAALTAGVQGMVKLECVVRADGTVGDIRVLEPLHPQLDEAATLALGQWRFKPGTKDGAPVAVRVEVEMSFTLRDGPPRHSPRGPLLGSPDVFRPGNGVSTPTLVHEVKPSYTPDAMLDKAQGMVKLEAVVLPDGTVGDVAVIDRVHPSLDEACVRTLRQWTFKPGVKDGVPVAVRIEVEMSFTLGPVRGRR